MLLAPRRLAWALAPLLAACAGGQPDGYGRSEDFGDPVVAWTPASDATFALAEAVQAGERGDLPGRARALGLVAAGTCREAGGGAVYCAAVRVDDVAFDRHETFYFGPVVDVRLVFDEVRMCLGPGRVTGVLIRGISSGAILPSLHDEHPEEFAPILASTSLVRRGDGSPPSRLRLNSPASLTNLSAQEAAARLRYGGPSPREPEAQEQTFDRRPTNVYHAHDPAVAACPGL